jgi:polysaccharide export outer membrane protein
MVGAGSIWCSAQAFSEPPRELVQYVRDAKRQGLKDNAIKQNAVAIGWPGTIVDEAIAVAKKPASVAASAATAEPAAPSVATPSVKETVPATVLPSNPTSASQPLSVPPASGARLVTSPVEDHIIPTSDVTKNRGVPDDYQIGAGDVLQISVWKEPDASVPSVVVRTDGKITMPVLKDVDVQGMTPSQVEKVVTERLAKVINGADVTVVVTAINSKKVYVVGAVRKEGPLPYAYRMTVMQAISEAGGLNDYAKRKKIYILRTENGKEYRLPFNYDQVVRGEHAEQNVQLLPGDTLVVPH